MAEASLALIDGDVLLYRCGFAADSQMLGQLRQEVAAEHPEWSEDEVKDQAKLRLDYEDYAHFAFGNLNATIDGVLEGRKGYKLYLTGPGNFREGIATILPYKGNRDPSHKPKYYKELKEYMCSKHHAIVVEGMEADDAMAMEQWRHRDKSTIIATIDKDLDMIPGWHYNLNSKNTYWVDIDRANYFFFWQMLVGDSTDNIPGINRIGKVRATNALEHLIGDNEAMKQVVWEMYQKQYGEQAAMAFNEVASLLWMIREEGKPCDFQV